jgi:fructose-1,6-bisphosphatase/inositol monophosphatase family enzyme
MHISTIADLLDVVRAAGQMALEAQREPGALERSFKEDGSVLTEIDGRVEEHLVAAISQHFPDANLVTEEAARPYDPGRPYTFTVDPIDGTDVYSQGMAGWCVSVGLQDRDLRPIAGILYAPRLDLLFFADVGLKATVNGAPVRLPDGVEPLSGRANLMISSQSHHCIDLRAFPGKARSIGSAALHLCFPVAYPAVVAGLQCPGAHIWDVAGAHAICASVGFCFEYWDGSLIDYSALLDGSSIRDIVVSGPRPYVEALKAVIAYLPES